MQLTQSPKFNRNYAAKIVEIKDFIKHPNPKCERLKCCTIDGYSIAVSIDTNPGTYIYFPIECAIDDRFLSANNLFRDKNKNFDKEQAGFFEDNCRVKIIKLQGYPSEGFITPITYLYNWLTLIGKKSEIVHKVAPGTEFDSVDGEIICRKYVPKVAYTLGQPREGGKIKRNLKKVKKVIKATWRRYRDFIIQEDIKSMLKKSPKHVDGGRPVILVDMDATLCLNTTGRPYFGEGAAEGMLDDIAIEGTCMLVRRMYEKCKVFIVTGREGTPEIIAATKKWLAKHDVVVDELFFRPVKDYSPGADCKKKIYEDNIKGKYNVQFVLEDNYKCVKMWREQGLVCLQPNEGKF
jgi:hypothetical protein